MSPALTPIVGHHLGKGNKERIAGDFYQFSICHLVWPFSLIGFVWGIAPMILKQIGLENVVAQIAIRYLYFLSLESYLCCSLVSCGPSRYFGNDASIHVLDALAFALNACFNYILIYGAFGFPEMGGSRSRSWNPLWPTGSCWPLWFLSCASIPKVAPFQLWKPHPYDFKGMKSIATWGFQSVELFCRSHHLLAGWSVNGKFHH